MECVQHRQLIITCDPTINRVIKIVYSYSNFVFHKWKHNAKCFCIVCSQICRHYVKTLQDNSVILKRMSIYLFSEFCKLFKTAFFPNTLFTMEYKWLCYWLWMVWMYTRLSACWVYVIVLLINEHNSTENLQRKKLVPKYDGLCEYLPDVF